MLVALLAVASMVACGDDDEEVDAGGEPPSDQPGDGAGTVPDEPADLVGEITTVTPFEPITEDCVPADERDPDAPVSDDDPPVCTPEDNNIVGTVLAEEQPGVQEGRKISYTVTSETAISGTGEDGSAVEGFDDLAVGQAVETWVAGDVCAESYPEQCGALAIVVTG